MGKSSHAQTSFNAGELSPRLEGRVDLDKYVHGCRTLENFLPMVQGGLIKRSGTRFVKAVKTASAVTRLVPFEFGTTQAYILEFGDLYVRVYYASGGALEATVAINQVLAQSPIRVETGPGHGFVTGNQVFITGSTIPGINNSYFHVTVINANQFDLIGTSSLGAGGPGGTVARVHEFVTPYTTAELDGLQFAQSADVLYIAHPNHAPRKLSRTGHTSWTLTPIAFNPPAFSDDNLDELEHIVANGYTGAGVRLYSTGGRFRAAHVGGFVSLAESLEGTYLGWAPLNSQSGAAEVYSNGSQWTMYGGPLFTPGIENAYAHYQGSLYQFLAFSSGSRDTDVNGAAPPTHKEGIQTDGSWDWRYVNDGYGWLEITSRVDDYHAIGTVRKELGRTVVQGDRDIATVASAAGVITVTAVGGGGVNLDPGDRVFVRGTTGSQHNNRVYLVTAVNAGGGNNWQAAGSAGSATGGRWVRVSQSTTANGIRRCRTWHWAFSAWSPVETPIPYVRGYPSSVAFFEDRLWWAGTTADPQGLWASRTGRYEDHLLTDEDDGALFLLLNTQQVNKIEWISAGKRLAIGTAGGEFIVTGGPDAAVTAGTAQANQHSFYGSRTNNSPLRVESVTLFVQRAGRKLIEFSFDFDSDNYLGVDLTVLANHVTLGRIKKMAWAQEPDRIVWAVLENGKLVGMTYDRKQEVLGWHRHPVGGTDVAVESVAVIPHPDGDRDQVWLIVRRTVNGSVVRHVEFFEATWLAGTAIADAFFVDAGLTYSGAPAATITGLWHLLNTPVSVLADGIVREGLTVNATGQITLPLAASKVHVGLVFTASLETMRMASNSSKEGTDQGKTKRVTNTVIRLEDTGKGLTYGPVFEQYAIADGALVSGDTPILPWPMGYEQEARINLRHAAPTPCTVIALFPQLLSEDR